MQKDPLVEILKSEFEKKCKRNAQYSLRSFSRDIDMDASNLSKIINYQKPVGKKLRERLAKNLGFLQEEVEKLMQGNYGNVLDANYEVHNIEIFQVVSEWQHYAILELFKLNDITVTPGEIVRQLGIPLEQAEESLQRLVDVKLVEIDSSGRFEAVSESSSSILTQATSKAHRVQQKEILLGAIDALESTPVENRSQSSMTMAIDLEKLDEAKELIKNFRRNLARLLSSSENLNDVYQLSVSLYPVTNNFNQDKL